MNLGGQRNYESIAPDDEVHSRRGGRGSIDEENPEGKRPATGARKRGHTSGLSASAIEGEGTLWTLLTSGQLASVVGAVVVLFIGITYVSFHRSKQLNMCLPAPYLYVSYGQDHNIMQLTRDGCVVMNRVLYGVPRKKMELRTMLMGSYKNDEALYVADASGKTENILVFGQCSYWSKMRTHITSTMGGRSIYKEGAQHSYGLSFDNDGNLYVSYQHTNAILRSQKDTFEPMALPQAMKNREGEEGLTFFEGTFYQFGEPKVQDQSHQGVRSIAWAVNNEYGELLWVVNEFENAIYIMDKAANVVRTITVPAPIGLYHDKEGGNDFTKGRIYVGSRAKKTGSVMVFDTSTFEQVGNFVFLTMSHPTGITVHDGVLYVADQGLNAILTFDLESSRFLKFIWERPDSNIEQLALSSC